VLKWKNRRQDRSTGAQAEILSISDALKDPAAPPFFGVVHRRVSISYQFFPASAIVRKNDNADARVDYKLQVTNVDGLSNIL
jgi:hypothetical protein